MLSSMWPRRIALIGDAAHATHPVGGAGLQHGGCEMSPCWPPLLSQAHLQGKDLGDERWLRRYQQQPPEKTTKRFLFGTDLAESFCSPIRHCPCAVSGTWRCRALSIFQHGVTSFFPAVRHLGVTPQQSMGYRPLALIQFSSPLPGLHHQPGVI